MWNPDTNSLQEEIYKLRKAVDSRQATIDSLMFEFCPERMTQKQIRTYETNQRAVEVGKSDSEQE